MHDAADLRPIALFLSPHLDDAVFSCGATLTRLAEAGWRCQVVTVFTRSMPRPSGFALECQLDKGIPARTDYMALRRAEDVAACRRVGAEAHWLDLPEAPHRGYASAKALFAERRTDDPAPAAVRQAIETLLRERSPRLVFCPEGIGAHVDHLVVREAVEAASLCHPPLPIYWRDQPYAARTGAPATPGSLAVAVDGTLADKRAAVALYRSQLGFQFGGAAQAGPAITAVARAEARAGRRIGARVVTGEGRRARAVTLAARHEGVWGRARALMPLGGVQARAVPLDAVSPQSFVPETAPPGKSKHMELFSGATDSLVTALAAQEDEPHLHSDKSTQS